MNTPDSDEFFAQYQAPTRTEDEPGILPRFFVQPYEKKVRDAKGEETGETAWEDREFIEINMKGNRLSKWVGVVTDEHRGRFKNAYGAFRSGRELAKTGTPLEEWAALGASQCMQWKAIGLRSVEDIAGLGDEYLPNLGMGGVSWRDKAKLWLKAKSDAGAVSKVADANSALERTIARQQRTIDDLSAKIDRLLAGSGVAEPEMPTRARKVLSVAE